MRRSAAHTAYVDIDGGTLTGGKACWHYASIPAGETVTQTVELRIDRDAPQGQLQNIMVTSTPDAASVRDSATVDVRGVTSGGSIPIVTG